ncbi:MAG TPA: hypothetical protein VLM40_18555, partial [Gemmata sp.]|nr:hypothetical protein [Gemmata sp.]
MTAVPTPFVITVDTEEEWDWSSGYPTGPARTDNIQRLPRFQDVCEQFGAAVTYFVNHAVLAIPESRRVILHLANRPRVEIAMHIHPWNTPPLQPVERVPERESFLHNLPPDLVRAKLDTVYSTFAECGLKPVSFRGGRYSSNPAIQEWLRDRGFVADSSVLPYSSWADDGAPDYRSRDPRPVRVPGSPPLWEIPLSLGFTRRPFGFWRRALAAAGSPAMRPFRLVGLLSRLGIVQRAWLNFENPLGERMLSLAAALRRMGMPYLCFTLHSSSLYPGGSPYSPDAAAVERLFSNLART